MLLLCLAQFVGGSHVGSSVPILRQPVAAVTSHVALASGYAVRRARASCSPPIQACPREAQVGEAAAAAEHQLRRYLADGLLAKRYPNAMFTGLALVFHG